MVVDYESAWIALQERIASKPQHGRAGLLEDMARIAAENRVPEGEKARLLRLYGVETSASSLTHTDSDTPEHLEAGAPSVADAERPGHHDQGGHDGTVRSARAAA